MSSKKSRTNKSQTETNQNPKFEEIQRKNQEILRQRVANFDDSDSEEEIDKRKVDALFKNYNGAESEVSRIQQFFENGENIDCLICKFLLCLCIFLIRLVINNLIYFRRHSKSQK